MRITHYLLGLILIISFIVPIFTIIVDGENILSEPETEIDDPVAVIEPFSEVKQGEMFEFNGTQSYDPKNSDNLTGGIVEWTWYLRFDGHYRSNQTEIGDEQVFMYIFDEPGAYIVNLSVTDAMGLSGWVEKILIVTGPDLQIMSFTFSDPDLRENDKPTITIAFTNTGTMDINSTWKLKVMDGTKTVREHTVTGVIVPGEIRYYNYSGYELKAGERSFEVILDVDGDILEMSEENNYFKTVVNVQEGQSSFEEIGGDGSPVILLSVIIIIILFMIFILIAIPVVGVILIVKLNKKKGK